MKIGKHLIKGFRFENDNVIFVCEGNATCTMTPPTDALKLISDDDKEYIHIFGSGVITAHVHHQTYNSIANFSTESTSA